VRRKQRSWRIQAPCLGRGEPGTFSAGKGEGNPQKKLEFEGPIRASLLSGGSLRGDRLTWEGDSWTFVGRPATLTRLRQRLAGPRVVRSPERIRFPEGISGALSAPEGDLAIRADRGEGRMDKSELTPAQVTLDGRVECSGQGWSMNADHILAVLDPAGLVKSLTAKGAVSLHGNMGEGRGDALVLNLIGGSHAKWLGKVTGMAEVQP
jgi:hypothetical protein